jgi:hypothetical protein
MKFKTLNALIAGLVLSVSSVANAGILLSEDFDPIDSTNWSIINGEVLGTPSNEFYDGNALYFEGSGIRAASTNSYDLSTGGILSFVLKIGGSDDTSTFEDAEAGEDVAIQYSLSNGDWTDLLVIDTEDTGYSGVWGEVSINLTGLTSDTSFRWVQISHSGSVFDNWAIDNVQLINNIGPSSITVPEPTTIAILGLALIGLASRRFKKQS